MKKAALISILICIAWCGDEPGTFGLTSPAYQSAPLARVGEARAAVNEIRNPQSENRIFKVTAYCPCKLCCGPHARGMTASGRPITVNGGRFCAADPRVPFGTMVRIGGYAGGAAVPVLDRGGKIKGDHIDVFFPTHRQAKAWGVRTVAVTVMKGTGK